MRKAYGMAGAIVFSLLAASVPAAEPDPKSATSATVDLTTKDPQEIATATIKRVLNILTSPEYKDAAKKEKLRIEIRNTILAVVDMKMVGNLTLANFRNKFSDEQFKQFTDTFSQLLFSTYIAHLDQYSGEQVLILGTERGNSTRMVVKTKTVTKTREIPVDLSFVQEDKHWYLYDIHIEGVSLIKNYRSQFREILIKRSPEQLLKQLEAKVKENEEKL